MTITLVSRKGARKEIADVLGDHVTALVAVYDHQTKDFGGRSPIAMVYSDGSWPHFPGYVEEWQFFLVQLWYRRENAQGAEDGIDDLEAAVRQALVDHADDPPYWHDLIQEDDRSTLDYVAVDNQQYRRVTIPVRVKVIS